VYSDSGSQVVENIVKCTGQTHRHNHSNLYIYTYICAPIAVLHTYLLTYMGHAVAQWLRHCTANWKVAGSISDGVTGIFH
jgi:hypothetical protein